MPPETSTGAKLDNIALAVNTLQGTITSMQTDITEIRTDVKDLRKAVYGNGDQNAGVMGRLKSLEEWKDARVWLERVIIGALVSEGIGIAFLVIHMLTTK